MNQTPGSFLGRVPTADHGPAFFRRGSSPSPAATLPTARRTAPQRAPPMSAVGARPSTGDARTAIGKSTAGIDKESDLVLELERVTVVSGGQTHLYGVDLRLTPGAINVLLGPDAGRQDHADARDGRARQADAAAACSSTAQDVTGVGVRQRNRRDGLPAVHQLPVDDGVRQHRLAAASCARTDSEHRRAGARSSPRKLHIEPFLQAPARPSCRAASSSACALARALAKDAPLMLLDEPLVNLDYKLREELRDELRTLFADGSTTVVYATTEPAEALLLGGYTAVLDAGRAAAVRAARSRCSNAPTSIASRARLQRSADEPADERGRRRRPRVCRSASPFLCRRGCRASGGTCRIGIRAGASAARRAARRATRRCRAGSNSPRLSGSDTYLHVAARTGGRAGRAVAGRASVRARHAARRCSRSRRGSSCSAPTASCCVAPGGRAHGAH